MRLGIVRVMVRGFVNITGGSCGMERQVCPMKVDPLLDTHGVAKAAGVLGVFSGKLSRQVEVIVL